MSETKTVFVVGAGASSEVELPVGAGLTERIAKHLEVVARGEDPVTRSDTGPLVIEALRALAKDRDELSVNGLRGDCRKISGAMQLAPSIDNYVHSNRGNASLEICSKLGIAAAVLESELRSDLFIKDGWDNELDFGGVNETWYRALLDLITADGTSVDDLSQRLASMAFIVFNYDRCIEHYLFHAIRKLYSIDETRVAEILTLLEIHHPFGVVGGLPWQDGGTTPFGATRSGKHLVAIANGVRTISESIGDGNEPKAWSTTLATADTVVFLGFAFHPLNMSLLIPAEPAERLDQIIGTAVGISAPNLIEIRNGIGEQFGTTPSLRDDRTCFELFDEFSRLLRLR